MNAFHARAGRGVSRPALVAPRWHPRTPGVGGTAPVRRASVGARSGETLCATVRACVRPFRPWCVSKNMQKYEKLEKIGEGELFSRVKMVIRRRCAVADVARVVRQRAAARPPSSPLLLSVNTTEKTCLPFY